MKEIKVNRFAVPEGIDIVMINDDVVAIPTGTANRDIGHRVVATPGARWSTNSNAGLRFLEAIAQYLGVPVNEYVIAVPVAEQRVWDPYKLQEAYTG